MVAEDRTVKPKAIKSNARQKTGIHISYSQAHRTKKAIKLLLDGDTKHQFQLITLMLRHIKQEGHALDHILDQDTWDLVRESDSYNGAFVKLQRSNEGVFMAAAVLPSASVIAWAFNRRLLVLDGAHCSSPYGGIVLIATTLDANDKTLILAWAIVPSESTEWWSWFLMLLQKYLVKPYIEAATEALEAAEEGDDPDIQKLRIAIITDRGKGLDPSITSYFPEPTGFHYYCTQHLAENVASKFGKPIEALFRQAVASPLKAEHNYLIEQIRGLSEAAVVYIDGIGDKRRYCTSYAPLDEYPRFGHTTSNIGESMNSRFREERKLNPLFFLEALWTKQMQTFYERRMYSHGHEEFLGQKFTKFALQHQQDRYDLGRKMVCYPSNYSVILIRLHDAPGAIGWIIDL